MSFLRRCFLCGYLASKAGFVWFTQLFIPNGYTCPECACMSNTFVYPPSRNIEYPSIWVVVCKWQLTSLFTACVASRLGYQGQVWCSQDPRPWSYLVNRYGPWPIYCDIQIKIIRTPCSPQCQVVVEMRILHNYCKYNCNHSNGSISRCTTICTDISLYNGPLMIFK